MVEASHGCMTTPGVGREGALMVTTRMLGAFRDQADRRQEFLAAVGAGGNIHRMISSGDREAACPCNLQL
jgi:hypothetical protein